MNHNASPSAPTGRTRRTVLLGLAILGIGSAVSVVRRPLMMSAPMCMAGRWHGCFDTFNGVVLMTLVALPLAALVVWALARVRRAAGVPSARAWRTSLAEVGMVHGTVPLVWLTMMPGAGPGVAPRRVSLVPLRDLVTMGPLGIVGNLLVFAALGFFAPMRFAAGRACVTPLVAHGGTSAVGPASARTGSGRLTRGRGVRTSSHTAAICRGA
ncbi:VanZ family protein [Streptomyces sp. NPDC005731]|uniref:VanZ family protein n=1 Tax=Streptomyces sp. NPDC005731 TaxID=3157056 RepID=UPI003404E31D